MNVTEQKDIVIITRFGPQLSIYVGKECVYKSEENI